MSLKIISLKWSPEDINLTWLSQKFWKRMKTQSTQKKTRSKYVVDEQITFS